MKPASRFRMPAAILATLTILASTTMFGSAAAPKFFDDDPVWVERDTEDASGITALDVDLLVDLTYNLVAGRRQPVGVRAQNLNTVDEVPDSSWFTNRLGHRPLGTADLARGRNTSDGPAPGAWTVTSSKSDGVTP